MKGVGPLDKKDVEKGRYGINNKDADDDLFYFPALYDPING